MKINCFLLLTALAFLFVTRLVLAADVASNVIVVKKMHCSGCAKRIAAKVQAVPGVEEVRADVAAKTLYVAAAGDVSPRALWEAVEAAKDTPVRLEGPLGTFTEKPAD